MMHMIMAGWNDDLVQLLDVSSGAVISHHERFGISHLHAERRSDFKDRTDKLLDSCFVSVGIHHRPLLAIPHRDGGPFSEGATPIRILQLVASLAASRTQDGLSLQDSSPELDKIFRKAKFHASNSSLISGLIRLSANFFSSLVLSSGPCLVCSPIFFIREKFALCSSLRPVMLQSSGTRYSGPVCPARCSLIFGMLMISGWLGSRICLLYLRA